MRLIDADIMLQNYEGDVSAYHNAGHALANVEGWMKYYLNNCPTIDAAPVVRGEWIHGCHDGAGTEFCYCSECNEDALKDKGGYTEFSRYCPNCGAKMDGEKEGV